MVKVRSGRRDVKKRRKTSMLWLEDDGWRFCEGQTQRKWNEELKEGYVRLHIDKHDRDECQEGGTRKRERKVRFTQH